MPKIMIMSGEKEGTEIPVTKGATTIGRVSACDITISDKKVSRQHCQLINVGTLYFIEDCGSSHGTWVNGASIDERIPLEVGQPFVVGRTMLLFCDDEFLYDKYTAQELRHNARGSIKKTTKIQKKLKVLRKEEEKAERKKKAQVEAKVKKRVRKELVVLKYILLFWVVIIAGRMAIYGGVVAKGCAFLLVLAALKFTMMTRSRDD